VTTRSQRAQSEHLKRIEEIEADIAESDDVVGELLFWARDPSSDVRGQAYRALIDYWEDIRVLPYLQFTLEREQDPIARGLVCIGLGRFLDTASEEGVLEPDYSPDSYTPEVFRDVSLSRRIFKRLLTICSNDKEDFEVQRRSLEALGSFAYRPEVRKLVDEMYKRSEEEAIVSALFAMGRSGLVMRYRKKILQHLEDPRPAVQFEAIQASEWWELRAALPYLRNIVLSPDNPNRGLALLAHYRCHPTPEQFSDLLIAVRERLPDQVFGEVLPEIQEQLLDDMEMGVTENASLARLFPDDGTLDPVE
jgi:hypothetical protein